MWNTTNQHPTKQEEIMKRHTINIFNQNIRTAGISFSSKETNEDALEAIALKKMIAWVKRNDPINATPYRIDVYSWDWA